MAKYCGQHPKTELHEEKGTLELRIFEPTGKVAKYFESPACMFMWLGDKGYLAISDKMLIMKQLSKRQV